MHSSGVTALYLPILLEQTDVITSKIQAKMQNKVILESNITTNKDQNQYWILNLIRQHAPISRIGLAGLSGLSTASITKITSNLLRSQLIREVGPGAATLGRKPILLEIDQDTYQIIGIDVGRYSIRSCLARLDGTILETRIQDFDLHAECAKLPDLIAKTILELKSVAEEKKTRVLGVGVVTPGMPEAPETTRSLSIEGRSHVDFTPNPFADYASSQSDLPIMVANATDGAALAESWFGAAKAVKSLVYLTIGTGVKAGMVVENEPYPNLQGFTPEFGHTTIDVNGAECWCGNKGCLELYISQAAILTHAKEVIKNEPSSILFPAVMGDHHELSVDDIFEAARAADLASRKVVDHLINYLGVGIVNLANLYNPELILIGTREMPVRGLDMLVEPLQEIVRKRAIAVVSQKVRIGIGSFGVSAYLYGAVTLVARQAFLPTGSLHLF